MCTLTPSAGNCVKLTFTELQLTLIPLTLCAHAALSQPTAKSASAEAAATDAMPLPKSRREMPVLTGIDATMNPPRNER